MLLVTYLGHCVKRLSNPNKVELLLSLDDMLQGDTIEKDNSQDWIKTVDRGRLKHVSSEMYMVICAMEIELQIGHLRYLNHISTTLC